MKQRELLSVCSLACVPLLALHISQDIVLGLDRAGLNHLVGIAILVVLVSGTTLMRDHWLGLVVMLLGGVMSLGMLPLHMRNGFRPEFLAQGGVLLFTFTLYLLGVMGAFTLVLAARALVRPAPGV